MVGSVPTVVPIIRIRVPAVSAERGQPEKPDSNVVQKHPDTTNSCVGGSGNGRGMCYCGGTPDR
jgi:hypothetical protein